MGDARAVAPAARKPVAPPAATRQTNTANNRSQKDFDDTAIVGYIHGSRLHALQREVIYAAHCTPSHARASLTATGVG
jgi:hypothetical protein